MGFELQNYEILDCVSLRMDFFKKTINEKKYERRKIKSLDQF